MKNSKKNLLLKMLDQIEIEYFSYSLFHNKSPVLSTCNNSEWLDIYCREFDSTKIPPVQKYITSSLLNVIMWESFSMDHLTSEYISLRNKIVGVRNNITILNRRGDATNCFTFGTSKSADYLANFISSKFCKNYLSKTLERISLT